MVKKLIPLLSDFEEIPHRYRLSTDVVDERLKGATVSALYRALETDADFARFHVRLRHVLIRYENNLARRKEPSNKLSARQLKDLNRHAYGLLNALDEVEDKVWQKVVAEYPNPFASIDFDWRVSPMEPSWEPEYKKRPLFEVLAPLLRAIQHAQEQPLATNSGRPKSNAALENLVDDLEMIYEDSTGKSAASGSYFSGQNDEYQGAFFDFVSDVILAYRPEKIFSNNALGKAIERAIKRD